MNPKISVIMGIYNCERTLKQSIESIINQSYKDWEFIICDDGSTDNTYKIAKLYEEKYCDKIKVLKNSENKGLNYTLNKCLEKAVGKYIARMDGDDISLLKRFETQVKVLEQNKDIDIVSSRMIHFDEYSEWDGKRLKEYPEKEDLIYGTPFCHAACMVRSNAIKKVGGYSDNKMFLRVEDYHLWMKMYQMSFRGMNIQEALYKMRDDKLAFKRRKFKFRINESYVKFLIYKNFSMKKKFIVQIFKPIVVGLLPGWLYKYMRDEKMKGEI